MKTPAVLATILAVCATSMQAFPLLYIHDIDGKLATVDVATGSVSSIGTMGAVMTDIAFDPTGHLYGLSFNSFFSIDPSTGASTFIGNHGITGGNALVFGTDGTLYAAGSSNNLYTLNVATGGSTLLGNIGAASAGDLAFNGGDLYLSSTANQLVKIDLSGPVSGTNVGPFGFSSVFGLATASNGVLYGVAGTSVFSVDTATGAGSFLSNYGGQGLGASFGSSFYTEAGAPLPPERVPDAASTASLLAGGLGLLAFCARKRKAG